MCDTFEVYIIYVLQFAAKRYYIVAINANARKLLIYIEAMERVRDQTSHFA